MNSGEQLAVSYQKLWDIQDPLDRMIIRTPRAAEYYGSSSWKLLREVGAKALQASPSVEVAPLSVDCAVSLMLDSFIDASAFANRLLEILETSK